jgi:flavin reductase (DIM6/NTAB) family NADH-FMN oxidoreductase RutF
VSGGSDPWPASRLVDPASLTARERYQLLTSLVVPRPIGWASTRHDGVANLAPFSYFAALASSPLLVGISVGMRGGTPKDTLHNIRATGCFCINVVSDAHLEAMNATAGEHPPEVDEFALAGVPMAEGTRVTAPFVADAPAVFECRLFREVELGEAPNRLVIGEVVMVHLREDLPVRPGTMLVDAEALRPVGRLGGPTYTRLGEVVSLARPEVERG